MTAPPPTASESVAPAAPAGSTWREVQQGVLVGDLILLAFMVVITLVLQGQFDATPLVIAAVVTGAIVASRRGRGLPSTIFAGVVSVVLAGLGAAFGGLAAFARPQSTFDLILLGGLLVTNLCGVVAFVGALVRRDGRTAAATWAPRLTGAALTLMVAVAVVAGVTAYSASPLPKDLRLKAHQFEFTKTRLTAQAGRVGVFVQNDDPVHHDFTIKGIVSTALPGEKARRAVFDIEPGTYRFYCTIHPDQMQGTLVVTR